LSLIEQLHPCSSAVGRRAAQQGKKPSIVIDWSGTRRAAVSRFSPIRLIITKNTICFLPVHRAQRSLIPPLLCSVRTPAARGGLHTTVVKDTKW